jgi:hypothetical protein
MTGYPTSFATRSSSALSFGSMPAALPGGGATPTLRASSRAPILSPSRSMASGGGPTKTAPVLATARANAAFSLKKP